MLTLQLISGSDKVASLTVKKKDDTDAIIVTLRRKQHAG